VRKYAKFGAFLCVCFSVGRQLVVVLVCCLSIDVTVCVWLMVCV
jgi:hypothetical protein